MQILDHQFNQLNLRRVQIHKQGQELQQRVHLMQVAMQQAQQQQLLQQQQDQGPQQNQEQISQPIQPTASVIADETPQMETQESQPGIPSPSEQTQFNQPIGQTVEQTESKQVNVPPIEPIVEQKSKAQPLQEPPQQQQGPPASANDDKKKTVAHLADGSKLQEESSTSETFSEKSAPSAWGGGTSKPKSAEVEIEFKVK